MPLAFKSSKTLTMAFKLIKKKFLFSEFINIKWSLQVLLKNYKFCYIKLVKLHFQN